MTTRSCETEADRWARPGSLLRRVYDCLADGQWHTGQELCSAYRGETGGGWEWQSCVSQLRKKLRPQGGDIEEQDIKGEYQGRYQMTLPRLRGGKHQDEQPREQLSGGGEGGGTADVPTAERWEGESSPTTPSQEFNAPGPHLPAIRTARTVAQMQEDGRRKRVELDASKPKELWDV